MKYKAAAVYVHETPTHRMRARGRPRNWFCLRSSYKFMSKSSKTRQRWPLCVKESKSLWVCWCGMAMGVCGGERTSYDGHTWRTDKGVFIHIYV